MVATEGQVDLFEARIVDQSLGCHTPVPASAGSALTIGLQQIRSKRDVYRQLASRLPLQQVSRASSVTTFSYPGDSQTFQDSPAKPWRRQLSNLIQLAGEVTVQPIKSLFRRPRAKGQPCRRKSLPHWQWSEL